LDGAGIDVTSLLIQGGRISLVVGVTAMAIGMAIGAAVGTITGYFGGLVDGILTRVTDYFLVIPSLPLMIIVAAIWGPSLGHIILVIGALQWAWTARIVRAQVKSVRQRTYVQRIRSVGAGHTRIVFGHVLPQIGPLLISLAVLHVGYAIFSEAALDFLGLGDPTAVSWGTMIQQAFQLTAVSAGAWWAVVSPGLCIAAVIVACYLLSQAVEDILDPGLRRANLSPRSYRVRPSVGVRP
jgi:peptide/nickel transport system permease protein